MYSFLSGKLQIRVKRPFYTDQVIFWLLRRACPKELFTLKEIRTLVFLAGLIIILKKEEEIYGLGKQDQEDVLGPLIADRRFRLNHFLGDALIDKAQTSSYFLFLEGWGRSNQP